MKKRRNSMTVRLNFNIDKIQNSQNKKILIVDDHNFNNNAIKIILEHICGLDVDKICVEAVSGENALKIIM